MPGDGYMEQILDFIVRHWQLSGLLGVLLTAYAVFEWRQGGDSSQVTAEQAIDLYNHHDAVLLDIRSNDAFKAGHIVGSTHVEEPESKLTRFNKYAQKTGNNYFGRWKKYKQICYWFSAARFI